MKFITATVFATLLCATLPAYADSDVTYRFKALVEYSSGPGTQPAGAELGSTAVITVVLNKKAQGTVTANSATYDGGADCGPNPSPIVSITATFGTKVLFSSGPGSCDSLTIQQDVDGVYSVQITSYAVFIGNQFTALFTSKSANAITSLAIPDHIDTFLFDRSTFMLFRPNKLEASGDLATR